jgi:hypothetical protein
LLRCDLLLAQGRQRRLRRLANRFAAAAAASPMRTPGRVAIQRVSTLPKRDSGTTAPDGEVRS